MRSRSTSVKPLSAAEVRDADVDPLFLVWIVSRSAEYLLGTVLAPVGLTGDEFAIYSILDASPGITPSDLSRWMAAPATSVSSYVKRLESRGHLTRRAHPSDRRSYRIQLTAAGKRAHRSAVALFGPVRARIIEALGDQDGSGPGIIAPTAGGHRHGPGRPAEHGGLVSTATWSPVPPKLATAAASDDQDHASLLASPDGAVPGHVTDRERRRAGPVPYPARRPGCKGPPPSTAHTDRLLLPEIRSTGTDSPESVVRRSGSRWPAAQPAVSSPRSASVFLGPSAAATSWA